MRLNATHAMLALVALMALLWGLAQYRGNQGASLSSPPTTATPASVAAPLAPAAVPVRVPRTVPKKTVSIVVAELEKPVERAKVRGEKLREEGEAMGGGTRSRTGTPAMTATTDQ